LVFVLGSIAVPLRYAPIGKIHFEGRAPLLLYFACLGAGFIILELVLIQLFVRLVGPPLYSFCVVIFVLLLAAGLGSRASAALGIGPERRFTWPFAGILAAGTLLLLVHGPIFEAFLASPLSIRMLVAG